MAGLRGNITLRYGVPMLHTHKKIDYGNKVNSFMERLVPSCGYRSKLNIKLLVIGGSFGLREFAQIRYDYQKLHRKMDPALKAKLEKSTTLESEYEKIKNSSFDDWKNVRGPRPWEDSISVQAQQKEALSSKSS
ncbi:cytochrome c oxidase assembly protein COX16 homolog, mitochondrial isoform X1 [Alligator sinensis]|uniref:Cytochrome c oxidase assembly protein COX16 homolog, mitochondrial n=1 Tax=Alligator sinensis TaxID=38654 RepID=A0A3Q0GPR5_ALLSI|nr:cytochrome c oxidase assembly protein COX16 homolog, mitochondrial isoform X1 [Alligator sinensis]